MNLQNIALNSLGVKVIDYSSSSDKELYHPSNVLSEKEDQIWNSAQGLPQFITISLEDVEVKYNCIVKIGFYCWHDYTTNPKVIEIEVAPSDNDNFVFWCKLELKQKSGKQYFEMQKLPQTYRIMKFTVAETFGDYETYLNQIYIFALSDDSKVNSMMAVKDLQSPLRNSYGNSKKQKNKFISKYVQQQQNNHNESIQSQEEDVQFQENTFHHKNKFASSKRSPSKHSSNLSEKQSDKSIQNDIALLTLSKNMMEMEQNIEEIKRSLNILNVKIDVTYQKIQEKFMEKIENMIDKKLQKMKHQIKNELKKQNKLRQSKSQHEKMQFLKSKQLKLEESQQEQRPHHRQAKQSLHLHNLKSNRVQKQSLKQVKVSDLMDKLAMKLKQRELKIKKIQSKREKNTYDNRSGIHRGEFI